MSLYATLLTKDKPETSRSNLVGLVKKDAASGPSTRPVARKRVAQQGDPKSMQIKLNQLIYDRRLSIKSGIDPDRLSGVDTQIRILRDQLRGM